MRIIKKLTKLFLCSLTILCMSISSWTIFSETQTPSSITFHLPSEEYCHWSVLSAFDGEGNPIELPEIDLVEAFEITATDSEGNLIPVTVKDDGGLDYTVAGEYTITIGATNPSTNEEETTTFTLYMDSEDKSISVATVGDIFTADITVGGNATPCTFMITSEESGNRTVQIGNGTDQAIDQSSSGAVVLPETVTDGNNTYTVTAIGNAAFTGCTKITDTGLGANTSITSIGDEAFQYCCSLIDTGLGINCTITSLGQYAFNGCINLTNTGLKSNNKITSIHEATFTYCLSLTDTGLGTNNTVVSIDDGAFYYCLSLINTGLGTNTSVTSLGNDIFGLCSSLKRVEFNRSDFSICKNGPGGTFSELSSNAIIYVNSAMSVETTFDAYDNNGQSKTYTLLANQTGKIRYLATTTPTPIVTPEPIKKYLVTFFDCKGNTVKTEWVPYKGSTTAPTGFGTYEGYTNVTADLELKPNSCVVNEEYVAPDTAVRG